MTALMIVLGAMLGLILFALAQPWLDAYIVPLFMRYDEWVHKLAYERRSRGSH